MEIVPSLPARRALTAAEAGECLAGLMGLDHSIPKQRMWHFARTRALPVVRRRRRVWFQQSALEAFVAAGGTARRSA
jgi:hypothetical protein